VLIIIFLVYESFSLLVPVHDLVLPPDLAVPCNKAQRSHDLKQYSSLPSRGLWFPPTTVLIPVQIYNNVAKRVVSKCGLDL